MTDQLLQRAAAQFSEAMIAGADDLTHDFSPRFQRKMQPLFRRARHPVRARALRRCAAILLVMLALFGSILALSPTVQAAVFGWIRAVVGRNIEYSTQETTPAYIHYEYSLPTVWEGYMLLDTLKTEAAVTYIYISESGRYLTFSVHRSRIDNVIGFFNLQDYIYCQHASGSFYAEIYIAPDSEQNSVIIWEDPETHALLYINADATREQLIALAEKVEKIKILLE